MTHILQNAKRLATSIGNGIRTKVNLVTSPVDGYASALVEARRLSLIICVILALSTYLFLEEQNRRLRVLDLIFFDHVFETIEKFDSISKVFQNKTITSPDYGSLSKSHVLPAIKVTASETMEPIAGVSTSIANCEVKFYKLKLTAKQIDALTDRVNIALAPHGDRHVLIEFPFLCNIFGKGETLYALVGRYKFSDKIEVGTIYDSGESFRRYASLSDIKSRILRMAQNETGKYYKDNEIKNAISKLLEVTENVPSIFGVSLPARVAGILLPIALALVSFAFYHRARRIIDNMETVWILVHAKGLLEVTMSIGWKVAIILSPIAVYLTASLYLSPSAELQGSIDVLAKQTTSTNSVSLVSVDVWLSGLRNTYVFLLCLLSLALNALALTSIYRIISSSDPNSSRGMSKVLSK